MVSGKRIILPCYRKQVTPATFSDHHTAVYALAWHLFPGHVQEVPLLPADMAAVRGLPAALHKAREEN